MNGRADGANVDLEGVPETMLWPLWNRAAEMRRQDRLIDDPMAVDLVERIDYDFAGTFGRPTVFHPIRARVCDDLVKDYVSRHPGGPVVVALGEGLDTQPWRVGDPRVRWCSVDLPEAIDVRRRLIPSHPKATLIERSALDPSWMDAVPREAQPFVSAAGLLMYFKEAEVRDLLVRIAARFPGGEVFFDTITPHVSRRTLRGMKVTKRYTAPAMPWGITLDDLPRFLAGIPGVEAASVQSYADPFPRRTRLYKLLSRLPPIRRRFAGGLVYLRMTPRSGGVGYC